MNNKIKNKIKVIVGLVIAIIIMITIFANIYTVDTGEVAIISRFGKIMKVEEAGLHFKIPFVDSKYYMETREQTYAFTGQNSLNVSTKDIQTVNIELTVQASVSDPEKLYKAFKGRQVQRFIVPRVGEITQATISKYTIEEFVSKRIEISQIIYEELKKDFTKYGLNVSNISIVNHDFSDEYEKAIERKKVAEQEVERAKAEQEKLSVEAANKVKLAEFKLQEKKLQAEANKIETTSLSPQILKKMYIEKWDGHLPKVQGNATTILGEDILK